jgi:AraC-like DNA-binding protein
MNYPWIAEQLAEQRQRDLIALAKRHRPLRVHLPRSAKQKFFAETLSWMQAHARESMSVRQLAARAAMSPRTFARRFLRSTGMTPYQWLISERIRIALQLLETTDMPLEEIAEWCGLRTSANLRKHFRRAVHISPRAYRRSADSERPVAVSTATSAPVVTKRRRGESQPTTPSGSACDNKAQRSGDKGNERGRRQGPSAQVADSWPLPAVPR